jgi:hypothetical protein
MWLIRGRVRLLLYTIVILSAMTNDYVISYLRLSNSAASTLLLPIA